jgi:predicted acetyltransferase
LRKAYPKDPSAPAAVLFSKRETSFNYSQNSGFEMVTEVEMKIKIYTKEGYEHASHVVYLYNNDTDKERIDISKAYTYNLVNGKVEKTKLKSEGSLWSK